MKTIMGRMALVVLCCAAGSLLLAARTSPAMDGAKVSCAVVQTPSGDVSIDQAARVEPGASVERSGGSCGHGIKRCSASQVGLPCDPSNPGVICSAQSNGSYCCLAYAQ